MKNRKLIFVVALIIGAAAVAALFYVFVLGPAHRSIGG